MARINHCKHSKFCNQHKHCKHCKPSHKPSAQATFANLHAATSFGSISFSPSTINNHHSSSRGQDILLLVLCILPPLYFKPLPFSFLPSLDTPFTACSLAGPALFRLLVLFKPSASVYLAIGDLPMS
jgi:hypothetical protein